MLISSCVEIDVTMLVTEIVDFTPVTFTVVRNVVLVIAAWRLFFETVIAIRE